MEVDYTGANSVAKLMEATGLTKFIVSRVGQHKNTASVYEFLDKSSNDRTIQKFREWAEFTDNNLPYEMLLFNSVEDSELIGEEVRNKKIGKVLKFTFCLNKKEAYTPQQAQNNSNQNISELIENALMKQRLATENNVVLLKLQEMEAKLAAYEEEEEEDEESSLSGLNNPNLVNIMALLSKALGGNNAKPTVVNGLQPQQIQNINTAIKTLSKYDSEIDSDLLKLANLAENNTDTFNMLLKTLRSM